MALCGLPTTTPNTPSRLRFDFRKQQPTQHLRCHNNAHNESATCQPYQARLRGRFCPRKLKTARVEPKAQLRKQAARERTQREGERETSSKLVLRQKGITQPCVNQVSRCIYHTSQPSVKCQYFIVCIRENSSKEGGGALNFFNCACIASKVILA